MKSKDIFNIGSAGFSLLGVYMLGSMFYTVHNRIPLVKEYERLSKVNESLVRNIDEWKRNIPLMKKQFAFQYKDSLENAVRDTTELGEKIRFMKQEYSKVFDKSLYSWSAFFMKD